MDFFQAWLARHACRRVFMERTVMTVQLEHFPNADVLIAEDCSTAQRLHLHIGHCRSGLQTTPLSAMRRALALRTSVKGTFSEHGSAKNAQFVLLLR